MGAEKIEAWAFVSLRWSPRPQLKFPQKLAIQAAMCVFGISVCGQYDINLFSREENGPKA